MRKNLFYTVSLVVISFIPPTISYCQGTTDFEKYLEGLVCSTSLEETTPQKYVMISDYMDYDIYGNFIKKTRVSGECTMSKDHDKTWNNIRTAQSRDLNGVYPKGEKHHYMENFSYGPLSNILEESFFESVPQANFHMKNIIWDMAGFETFAWLVWDSLQLNSTYSAKEINAVIDIPGAGTFENKDIQVTWTGITKCNNKICRIIKYNVMSNPMKFNLPNVTLNGRSHYWGNIYVSIADKQIEYADQYEDVLLEIKKNGQETGNIVNTVRYITLQKPGK